MAGLSEEDLEALSKRIAPSEDYRRACQKCLMLLKASILPSSSAKSASSKRSIGPVRMEICGSHAQRTQLDGADMDVVLRIAPSVSKDEQESFLEEMRERLATTPFAAGLEVHGGMVKLLHTECPLSVRTKSTKPVMIAHVLLGSLKPGVGAAQPVSVDAVVERLCNLLETSRDVVRLAKLWATNCGLTGCHEGRLGGVAWAMLALCFLQVEKLLPSYADILSNSAKPVPTELPSYCQLLRSFFAFLAKKRDRTQRGFSVMRGQEVPAPSGAVFIEDPGEFLATGKRSNLAVELSEADWGRIVEEARKAEEKLTAPRPLHYFHWSEVFDPRQDTPDMPEEPPEKKPRLPSLLDALGSSRKPPALAGGGDARPASARPGTASGGKLSTGGGPTVSGKTAAPSAATSTNSKPGGKGPGVGTVPPVQGGPGRGKGPGGKGGVRY